MSKRIVSLDACRGIGIFAMTVFHAIQNVFKTEVYGGIDPGQSTTNPAIAIAGLTIGIFGYWRAFFLMISASVQMYSMNHAIRMGKNRKSILTKQLFAGVLIYCLGVIREGIFNAYGFLGYSYVNRAWSPEFLRNAFVFDTLNMIGISTIFTAIIHYFLTRNDGVRKVNKILTVYAILIGFFVLLETPVHDALNNLYGGNFVSAAGEINTIPDGIIYLFFSTFAGMPEPIFPFMATSFIGCIIGILLDQDKLDISFVKRGWKVGFSMMGLGLFICFVTQTPIELDFAIQPMWFFIYNTGTQINMLFLAIWIGEFRRSTNMEKTLKITRYWRRWGILSLTIYYFQIIDIIPREILYQLTGLPFNKFNQLDPIYALMMVGIMVVIWETIIRLWERKEFKYSMEWILIWIGSKLIGIKMKKEDPLDIKGLLYDVEQIRFTELYKTYPAKVAQYKPDVPLDQSRNVSNDEVPDIQPL
jgi:hypothetical protein